MKTLERIFPWLLLLPVILPVIIWGGFIYPYLVPKTLSFYAFILLSAAVFVILVTHKRLFYWSRLQRWVTWIPFALLVLAYLASWFGLNFYRSFWSLFIRGDGLLMLTCAVASFYLILLSANRVFLNRFLRAVAVVATFVALYGIGEWFIQGGRIGGLLGNAAFFAGYLGIALFATIAAAQGLSRNWRRAAYAGAALQIIAIVLSATRGTILALGVAFVVWLVYRAFKKSAPPPAEALAGALRAARPSLTPAETSTGSGKKFARITLATIVILGGLFIAFRGELATVPFAPVARIASISTHDTDVASRLFIWKNMVGQILQHPLLGVGTEHIDYLFNQFYDPTQIVEQWFDRSHNAFLDYAAQYGIGGLILYLALIGSFFYAARRFWKRGLPGQGDRRLGGIVALLALVYAVQNFFVFDTVTSFWLFLALLATFLALSFSDDESGSEPTAISFSAWHRGVSWLVAIGLVLLIIPVSIQPARAAYDLAQAYLYQLTNVPAEVQYLSSGLSLGTYGDLEYGYEAYDMYALHQHGTITGTALLSAYKETESILEADFNRYPYDARTALYLAQVLMIAPSGVSIDHTLLSNALARAIQFSPKRVQSWYILANLSINEANTHPIGSTERAAGYAAAEDILQRYLALVPNLSEPHFVLAQLLYASGDKAGAAKEAALGKQYYTSNLTTASRAASYYENAMDLPDAAFFLSEVVRLDPTNTAAIDDLAKIRSYEQSTK